MGAIADFHQSAVELGMSTSVNTAYALTYLADAILMTGLDKATIKVGGPTMELSAEALYGMATRAMRVTVTDSNHPELRRLVEHVHTQLFDADHPEAAMKVTRDALGPSIPVCSSGLIRVLLFPGRANSTKASGTGYRCGRPIPRVAGPATPSCESCGSSYRFPSPSRPGTPRNSGDLSWSVACRQASHVPDRTPRIPRPGPELLDRYLGPERGRPTALRDTGIPEEDLRSIAGSDRVINGSEEFARLYDRLEDLDRRRPESRSTAPASIAPRVCTKR